MTAPHLDTVLLDLDGTLVDSADGILGSLRAALAERGLPEPAAGLGRELLGPPMYVTLPPLFGADEAAAIVGVYRRIYAESGWLRSTPYEGIDAMLRELVARGLRIAVATSKQEAAARLIVEKQGWAGLIEDVCGDTPDAARPTKESVIGEALSRLGSTHAVMVGDRRYDVAGAHRNGLGCIGAGWGYAEPGELIDAGASAVCATPADLVRHLGLPPVSLD
ncbi:5'-nucleotidase [Actinoplanes sp. OR16]|uniref:HAD hydrolase-like protein n=1 Tax=Actinoplanes sp. OR16 TaxID=946334 RepID=UPI000F6E2596|nr:HAD hydrolase-like protein [Actinoplanes sp. OR16]BBH69332.1 5'-nucleotidase [Actinoplanes sp. OR16]